MIRGDVQGGSITGAQGMSHMPGGGAGTGGNIAIEQYMKWHWAFFVGALLVTVTGFGTVIYWLGHPAFAPATFFFEGFLCTFGIVMLVLDTPIPHVQNHRHIQAMRHQIYKFALFMTRFIGRGVWYLFLATMVFGALWDTGINWFLGFVATTYLVVLGIVAIGKGFLMSNKLNRVRERINESGSAAERYVSQGGKISSAQLQVVIESVTGEKSLFAPDELPYVVNAISFSPYNDGMVTLDEFKYWLAPGPPVLV